MCMQNIDHTFSSDGYDVSYLTHFHFRVIQNNIMNFINYFWSSDLIWTTWNWYGFCAHTTTTKFSKPLLNHSIRRSRVRIIFIEFGLGFWWRFLTQNVVFNQHTKFHLFLPLQKFRRLLVATSHRNITSISNTLVR